MNFQSYSQAGQDRFAWEASGRKQNGLFLDVGAGNAIHRNNTYGLELLGWNGDLVDNSDVAQREAKESRKAWFHLADATKIDWTTLYPGWIDYLSMDVDEATLPTMERIPWDKLTFGALTVEHDAYRFGPNPREEMRRILKSLGYDLIASNVMCDKLEFEDWWTHPSLSKNVEKARCDRFDWQEIIRRFES